MEKTKTNFFAKKKWHIPRRFIVVSKRLCDREFKKLRQWLDDKDNIEIGTDSEQRIWILNRTKIEEHQNRKKGPEYTLSIREDVYFELVKLAEKNKMGPAEFLEYLIQK